MERLRQMTSLARWTAVWFALFVAVAVATPLVKPGGLWVVCTGGGMSLVDDGGSEATVATALDCPACWHAEVPLPPAAAEPAAVTTLAYALTPLRAAVLAYLTAPPLPSRGPPALS